MMDRAIKQMPGLARLENALSGAGFCEVDTEPYNVSEDLRDQFLYCGKHRPEMYLDPRVRAGISSFASLIDDRELNEGLGTLAEDIESGRISDIIADALHTGGDYVFVVASNQA